MAKQNSNNQELTPISEEAVFQKIYTIFPYKRRQVLRTLTGFLDACGFSDAGSVYFTITKKQKTK